MIKAFVSYNRKSSSLLANLVWKELRSRKIEAFMDIRDIDSVGPFDNILTEQIFECDVFVCLLAAYTLESDWVRQEIEKAHAAEKSMIPIFQEDFRQPGGDVSECVRVLLSSQGINILDKQGLYIQEAIDKLANLIANSEVKLKCRKHLHSTYTGKCMCGYDPHDDDVWIKTVEGEDSGWTVKGEGRMASSNKKIFETSCQECGTMMLTVMKEIPILCAQFTCQTCGKSEQLAFNIKRIEASGRDFEFQVHIFCRICGKQKLLKKTLSDLEKTSCIKVFSNEIAEIPDTV